ncbi:MFS transporter [Streptomyces griseus]|uniref:MFS transporter n=1 Tax=Streptomyces griseus TaxID=1911 RepID=UPI00068A47B1|nr:MFS transporter [Streptomyces griseus]
MIAQIQPLGRGRPGEKVSIFLVLMTDSVVNGLFVPMSLLYLSATSGESLVRVGTLLSIAGAITLPLPLWVGRLVDGVGPKRVVLVAQLLQAAGFAGYLVTTSPTMLFLAAFVTSLGQRAFWSSVFTLVSYLADGDSDARARERWFGVIGSLRAAGYGVGALTAGVILSMQSNLAWRGAIAADVLLLVAAAVLVGAGVPDRAAPSAGHDGEHHERGYRVLWADRPYLGLVALNTVFALCNVMLGIAFPPFVTHRLPSMIWAIGPLLATNTIVQAIFQPLVVRLIRPFSRDRSLCLAGSLWASWACLTMAPEWAPRVMWLPCLVTAILCYSAAQLVHSPVSNALAADAAPDHVRGRYLAIFQTSFAVATVVAPLMFSVLFEQSSSAPWASLVLLGLLTIPTTLFLASRLPKSALLGRVMPA